MTSTRVVTKEELLESIGPWQVLLYYVDWLDSKSINLIVELRFNSRIIDNYMVLILAVNLDSLSKAEVIHLINSVNTKAIESWQQVFSSLLQEELRDINSLWSRI